MRRTDSGQQLAEISEWIDSYPPNAARDREAALWGRISKVTEENGEVTDALIGATNQNPRKGQTHTLADVRKELLDVAVTALAAVEHMDGNKGQSVTALFGHIEWLHGRAGLEVAP